MIIIEKQQKFLINNSSYASAKKLTPKGIVVHSTGVNQKKLSAYWKQFNSASVRKSVHGSIGLDDNKNLIYQQWLPHDIQCWGCGSGKKGSYNNSYIQFEICEDATDEDWTYQIYAAALELCTEWCIEYEIDPNNVVCHSEAHSLGYASNHADVMHWWPKYGLSMDKFRSDLSKKIGDENLTQEQFNVMFKVAMEEYRKSLQDNDASEWSKSGRNFAVSRGIFSGSDPLPDGSPNFMWEDLITREQLATLLERFYKLLK